MICRYMIVYYSYLHKDVVVIQYGDLRDGTTEVEKNIAVFLGPDSSVVFHNNNTTPIRMKCLSLWIVLLAFHTVHAAASSATSTGLTPSLSGMSPRFTRFSNFLLKAQQEIIATLEKEDGKELFVQDPWTKQSRTDGTLEGHGITAVMQRGDLLEKGAVSTTIITGRLTEERAKAISSRSGNPDIVVGKSYAAAALSLVLHSKNPMVRASPCRVLF